MVEFVTLGVLMLLPLVYLVVVLGRVQAASYAADGAARSAARAMVAASDETQGRSRAQAALRLALLDQGLAAGSGALRLTCATADCLDPGGQVRADVSVSVPLPGAPAFLVRAVPSVVTVSSTQVLAVDAFRPGAP